MKPGKLDRRCRFERRAEATDAYGNVTDGEWECIAVLWGDLMFQSGRERIAGGRQESAVSANLRIRASGQSRGISAADRVVIDNAEYVIRAVMEPPRSGMIEMTLERGVVG